MKSALARLRAVRPGRDRLTGYIVIALIAALVATGVVLGTGAGRGLTQLADIGAWLGNSNGTTTHVNGLNGKVDGMVAVTGTGGHRLEITQVGPVVIVVDTVTGQVSRIDPAQLTVSQSRTFRAGVSFVAGADAAYVVDPALGTVERVDPVTLATIGLPLSLPAPLGRGGIDGRGALWLPTGRGTLLPVAGGVVGEPVRVGSPGDPLTLTIAAGNPVVTNARTGALTVLGADGARLSVNLPPAMADPRAGAVLAPERTDGLIVPVLAADGTLVLVDTGTGALTAVTVPTGGDRLAAPHTLGGRVYIPNESAGSLVVYNVASAQFERQVPVTGRAGPLTVLTKDGLLWANDPYSADAAVVSPDGQVHHVGKYETAVPGAPSPTPSPRADRPDPVVQPPTGAPEPPVQEPPAPPTSAVLPATTAPAPGPATVAPQPTTAQPTSARPTTAGPTTAGPRPTTARPTTAGPTTPPPTTAPPASGQPPGTVSASSGAGSITVSFAPAGGGVTPTGYSLVGAPAGSTVTPGQVPPSGRPFTFTVTGGSCDRTYRFTVVAHYPGGDRSSPQSVAVRPCVAPSVPLNFTGTPVVKGVDLRWSAPANPGGGTTGYKVSWVDGQVANTQNVAGLGVQLRQLRTGHNYLFELTASNAAGSSNPPAQVWAMPK